MDVFHEPERRPCRLRHSDADFFVRSFAPSLASATSIADDDLRQSGSDRMPASQALEHHDNDDAAVGAMKVRPAMRWGARGSGARGSGSTGHTRSGGGGAEEKQGCRFGPPVAVYDVQALNSVWMGYNTSI